MTSNSQGTVLDVTFTDIPLLFTVLADKSRDLTHRIRRNIDIKHNYNLAMNAILA